MSNRLLFDETARLQSDGIAPAGRWISGRVPSWNTLRTTWRRYWTRQRISQLDSHILKDIGVSFAEAEAEANKPFWRA
jgi:uncharacterized protein YjiS (DUF1127 family)